jgi:hypothetical protein
MTFRRCGALVAITATVAATLGLASGPQNATGMLKGSVISSVDHALVRGAAVIVSSLTNPALVFSSVTEADGTFQLENVPSGRFAIRAAKPGWVDSTPGGLFSAYLGIPITVGAAPVNDIRIYLTPAAVVSGTVWNSSGEPLPGVEVTAFRYVPGVGIDSRMPVGQKANRLTDDVGQYRIYGLPPGQVVLVASVSYARSGSILHGYDPGEIQRLLDPTHPPVSGTGDLDYAPVYFPSSLDASGATPVRLGAGEEHLGADIRLQFVHVVTLEGIVSGGANTSSAVQLTLSPSGSPLATLFKRTATMTNDGRFFFSGVPPGQYQLFAESRHSAGAGPARSTVSPASNLYAQTDVVVSPSTGTVTLNLAPGVDVRGAVSLEGFPAPSSDTLRSMSVSLMPLGMTSIAPPAVIPDDNGAFVIPGVPPGVYRIYAGPPRTSEAWYLDHVQRADGPLKEPEIAVSSGSAIGDLVLSFTRRAAVLQGHFDAGAGVDPSGYLLILFPTDRSWWGRSSGRSGQVRPAPNGDYAISSLPPGEYFLAAVPATAEFFEFLPATLDQVADGALKVTLSRDKQTVQDLRVRSH